jgi:hypothetical protein
VECGSWRVFQKGWGLTGFLGGTAWDWWQKGLRCCGGAKTIAGPSTAASATPSLRMTILWGERGQGTADSFGKLKDKLFDYGVCGVFAQDDTLVGKGE